MRNSESRRAEQVLEALLEAIAKAGQPSALDESLHDAARCFTPPHPEPHSAQEFIACAGGLVAHLYQAALPAPRHVPERQACAEAVHLLERGYEGPFGRGYDAALWEALEEGGRSMDLVLASLAEIIKAEERRKVFQGEIQKHFDPLDWQLKCQVIEVFLRKHAPLLPTALQQCPPAQLADNVLDLIALVAPG